jgi:hypothetical protein
MKFTLILTTLTTWALWLGGTIATFVIGLHFFKVLPHDQAGPAANAMFHAFGKYELALTGLSLLSAGMLLVAYPSKSYVLLLGVLILAGTMVITVVLGFMPIMDDLIADHQQQTPKFMHLHGESMITMTVQSGLLLLAGALILGSIIPVRDPATSRRRIDVKLEPHRV